MKLKLKSKNFLWRGFIMMSLLASMSSMSSADVLLPGESDYAPDFGSSVSNDNYHAFIGSPWGAYMGSGSNSGLVYYYGQYSHDSAPYSVLVPPDGTNYGPFGSSISSVGNSVLVGAPAYGGVGGGAFYFRVVGRQSVETFQLILPIYVEESPADCDFGHAVAMKVESGEGSGHKTALVGAPDFDGGVGAIFYYGKLDDAGPDPIQGQKLSVEDTTGVAGLGSSISMDLVNGLVGAPGSLIGSSDAAGAAFYYSRLFAKYKLGNVADLKLVASDPMSDARLGAQVSLSGDSALLSAPGAHGLYNSYQGAAYYYRSVSGASGEMTEDAKLVRGSYGYGFAASVALSGNIALVGSPEAYNAMGVLSGVVFVYRNMESKVGTVMEDVRLYVSEERAGEEFGKSISLSGDEFLIGATGTRKAYRGDIRAFTDLDAGSTSVETGGISFEMQGDWTIGATTDHNKITLSSGDRANVSNVVIGGEGVDNVLQLEDVSLCVFNKVILHAGNSLMLKDDYSDPSLFDTLFNTYFGQGNKVHVSVDGVETPLTSENYASLVTVTYDANSGYTTITALTGGIPTPEPSTLGEPSISGGTVTINALGKAGNYYALYASTNLLGDVSSWTQVTGTTGQIATDGTVTISFPKSAAGVEFYRMVTSVSPYTGSLNVDSAYSMNVVGRYDVTIPAGKKMLVGRQLSGTQSKVSQLFTALPRSSTVTVSKNGQFEETERHRITGAWSSDAYTLEVGEAAQVYNAGTSAVTITFTGEVLTAKAFNMEAGKYSYACSMVPVTLTSPENMGYVRGKEDVVNKYENDVYVGYGVHRITGQWSSGAPSFKVGEGMLFQLKTAQQWTEIVSVDASSLKVSRTQ